MMGVGSSMRNGGQPPGLEGRKGLQVWDDRDRLEARGVAQEGQRPASKEGGHYSNHLWTVSSRGVATFDVSF